MNTKPRKTIPQAEWDERPQGGSAASPRRNVTGPAAPAATAGSKTRDAHFSVLFYQALYDDMSDKTPDEAAAHWHTSGRSEGRFSHPAQAIEEMAKKGRIIPDDFDARLYYLLHPQIFGRLSSEQDARAHYLVLGHAREIAYKPADPRFVTELYLDDQSFYSQNLRDRVLSGEERLFESVDDLMAAFDFHHKGIVSLFSTPDYLTSHGRLGLRNQPQCLHHFASQGATALAPINFNLTFDADFYRDINREILEFSPAAAYRHWLTIGIVRDEQPNAGNFLAKLLLHKTDHYPAGFNPDIYQTANPDLAPILLSKWRLLQHCIVNGIAEGRGGTQLSLRTVDIFRAAADRQAIEGRLENAKRIYQDVLRIDPGHITGHRHYADCLFRLGDWYSAAQEYQAIIDEGYSTIWSFLNLASCLVELRQWQAAANSLRRLAQTNPGDMGITRRLLEVCRSGYDTLRNQALWYAENGFDDEAKKTIAQAMDLIQLIVLSPNRMPALNSRALHAVAIVADLGLNQCRFYRVEQKCEQFAKIGIKTVVFDFQTEARDFVAQVASFDAVIFYRVPATPDIMEAIDAARRVHKPSFYEIDDLMFDGQHFPEPFDTYAGQISRRLYGSLVIAPAELSTAMALCDFGIASTPALAAQMQVFLEDRNVFLHRNALHSPHERMAALPPFQKSRDRIRIFYGSGTAAHNVDFDLFVAPALLRILSDYPAVDLVIVGFLKLPLGFEIFKSRITAIDPIWDVQSYWQILGTMDINLAVLKPGLIADCKSEIKWLEAALFGVPSVVTPTQTYREVVSDHKTGLFATDATEWYVALRSLIVNAELRHAIGQAARKVALQNYGKDVMAQKLGRLMGHETSIAPPTRPRKRLLLVNVFFPPQAIGGATRVVADNALDISKLFPDEFEIQIFTSIEGSTEGYRTSTNLWQGIQVNGISTPDDPEIDRRLSDEAMVRAFEACVDAFEPDIIHFHCVQRLTAAICDVPLRRSIPYYITVHDGWWVSDHQFVIDETGEPCLYDYRNLLQEASQHGVQRLSRMQLLSRVIAGAEELLTVSAPFADLYESTGLRRPMVIENGLTPVNFKPRTVSAEGRVRLAHIGGIGLHKGYPLVQAAFISSPFRNLELLVIDHAMMRGIDICGTWGTTPVTFRGKTPQSDIAELYKDIDVLLAPSVWPESYGLVVREALQAGCWVIASDRGAVGADVTPGSGHIVPVTGYEPLREVLRQIDNNPARYLGPIEHKPKLRTSADQARDLARLYLGRAAALPKPAEEAKTAKLKSHAA